MDVTVDVVVFDNETLIPSILLIQRRNPPFEASWALPGGFVDMNETIVKSALRELQEETSVELTDLNFIDYFDGVDRDPRGRTLSLAFFSVVKSDDYRIEAKDDAINVKWFTLENLPSLAFDHAKIVESALNKIKAK